METNRALGLAELDVSRTVRDPALPQKCGLHPRNDMQNCLSSDLHMHAPVHMNMHTERERDWGEGQREIQDVSILLPRYLIPTRWQLLIHPLFRRH